MTTGCLQWYMTGVLEGWLYLGEYRLLGQYQHTDTDIQTHRQTDRQTQRYRHDWCTGKQAAPWRISAPSTIATHRHRDTGTQTDRQRHRDKDIQTQRYRHNDRQTDTEIQTDICSDNLLVGTSHLLETSNVTSGHWAAQCKLQQTM